MRQSAVVKVLLQIWQEKLPPLVVFALLAGCCLSLGEAVAAKAKTRKTLLGYGNIHRFFDPASCLGVCLNETRTIITNEHVSTYQT